MFYLKATLVFCLLCPFVRALPLETGSNNTDTTIIDFMGMENPPLFPSSPTTPVIDTSSVELEAAKNFSATYTALREYKAPPRTGNILESAPSAAERASFIPSFSHSNKPSDARMFSQIADSAEKNTVKVLKLEYYLEEMIHKIYKDFYRMDARITSVISKRIDPLDFKMKQVEAGLASLGIKLADLNTQFTDRTLKVDASLDDIKTNANEMHAKAMEHIDKTNAAALDHTKKLLDAEKKAPSDGGIEGTGAIFHE